MRHDSIKTKPGRRKYPKGSRSNHPTLAGDARVGDEYTLPDGRRCIHRGWIGAYPLVQTGPAKHEHFPINPSTPITDVELAL